MERRPADAQPKRRGNAFLTGNPDAAHPKAETSEVGPFTLTRRASTAGREEEEARALLIGVPKEATMRVTTMSALEIFHVWTLRCVQNTCLTNPGNYS